MKLHRGLGRSKKRGVVSFISCECGYTTSKSNRLTTNMIAPPPTKLPSALLARLSRSSKVHSLSTVCPPSMNAAPPIADLPFAIVNPSR